MYGSNFHKKTHLLSNIEKVYKYFSGHLILETYDIFRLANVATVFNLLDEINLKYLNIKMSFETPAISFILCCSLTVLNTITYHV